MIYIFLWIDNPKEGNPLRELSISIDFGGLECWNDERVDVFFFQHSNTPSLHYAKAETFKNFGQPLNYLIYWS
jgi:hypothetical protein